LKREREADPGIAKIAGQFLIEREPGTQRWQQFEHAPRGEVAPAQERPFQTGLELLELDSVVLHEPAKGRGIGRTKCGNRLLHPLDVRGGVQLASRTENQAVLRIEPDQLQLIPQIPADCPEDRFEDLGVEEKGGAEVEPKAVPFQSRRAPAHLRLTFKHGHAQIGLSQ
jgi:hypothetical protein